MRDLKYILKHKYDVSRALVIGIDQYENASPLSYAVSDAEELKDILIQELNFEPEDVIYLTNNEATKANILKYYLSFTSEKVMVDDRLIVFFAGHGYTKNGYRGDVGYLVPYDADMDDASTFIRWDELTRNAELIRAKHILYIMDACYGGLAVTRDAKAGSSRFLNDMYQRFSRQVITAGKANEVVADSGGPLPNHSVFTGHLIEGIRGKAANEFGVITANGLMAYVYNKVSNDLNSEQTPHYGQFDGDGDFIIVAPNPSRQEKDATKEIDELITVPYASSSDNIRTLEDKVNYTKELLASENTIIKLQDFTSEEIRRFLSLTTEDHFQLMDGFSDDGFLDRLSRYESCIKDLCAIIAVSCHWASEAQLKVLRKIVLRVTDRLVESQSGTKIWIALRWYPLLLLVYSAGIAAVESKNYSALYSIFYSEMQKKEYGLNEQFLAEYLSTEMSEIVRVELFKKVPGHDRNHTPLSEYLYKYLQPLLDDLLFLGNGYEAIFDEFEVLYALAVADLRKQKGYNPWGPVGRFGWKHANESNPPLSKIINDAEANKNDWPPLKAGMFGGDYERFITVANEYREYISKLGWW